MFTFTLHRRASPIGPRQRPASCLLIITSVNRKAAIDRQVKTGHWSWQPRPVLYPACRYGAEGAKSDGRLEGIFLVIRVVLTTLVCTGGCGTGIAITAASRGSSSPGAAW